MWWALRATLCSLSHCAVQSVVCRQDSTLKPLVIPLYQYVILCPIVCFEGFVSLQIWRGCSFVVKCGNSRKSIHPPLWQTCKVLRPWALFRETTVLISSNYQDIVIKVEAENYQLINELLPAVWFPMSMTVIFFFGATKVRPSSSPSITKPENTQM